MILLEILSFLHTASCVSRINLNKYFDDNKSKDGSKIGTSKAKIDQKLCIIEEEEENKISHGDNDEYTVLAEKIKKMKNYLNNLQPVSTSLDTLNEEYEYSDKEEITNEFKESHNDNQNLNDSKDDLLENDVSQNNAEQSLDKNYLYDSLSIFIIEELPDQDLLYIIDPSKSITEVSSEKKATESAADSLPRDDTDTKVEEVEVEKIENTNNTQDNAVILTKNSKSVTFKDDYVSESQLSDIYQSDFSNNRVIKLYTQNNKKEKVETIPMSKIVRDDIDVYCDEKKFDSHNDGNICNRLANLLINRFF